MKGVILRSSLVAAVLTIALAAAAPLPAKPPPKPHDDRYTATSLVSDQAGKALTTDPNLVNGWGLARSGTSPWWVSDNGPGKATLYNSAGAIQSLVVTVDGGPTGAVFAGIADNFLVGTSTDSTPLPAKFIFASEDGKIRAWQGGTTALVTADRSGVDAIYKGLAISNGSGGPLLYATDFHNGRVDVFNGAWHLVTTPGAFTDPKLHHGYAPFGIQTIGSRVFVTYARQDKAREDDAPGHGRGFVDAYDLEGTLLGRVAQHGQLNAPWGLALAPASFGRFGGDLLVGNFGDGRINAYAETKPGHFEHRGTLRDAKGKKLTIDGLWALEFGNDSANGDPNTLFLTAGPNDEHHGLFGKITAESTG